MVPADKEAYSRQLQLRHTRQGQGASDDARQEPGGGRYHKLLFRRSRVSSLPRTEHVMSLIAQLCLPIFPLCVLSITVGILARGALSASCLTRGSIARPIWMPSTGVHSGRPESFDC